MDYTLNINKIALEKFLSKENSKFKKNEILRTEMKYQSCVNLKDALETSINALITNNKYKSTIIFPQTNFIKIEDCGFYNKVVDLKNIIKYNTGLDLVIKIYDYPLLKNQNKNELEILLQSKNELENN